MLKTFCGYGSNKKSEMYNEVNEQINKYAKHNNLYIKSVHYERFSDAVVANVLFSEIPNEVWLL